ncbi:DUF6723 family protein [Paraburkholderia azotifigens]|uniref:DUF6723 family protein n=1 Tax=Paraburkholderia azotifigens TaxID=2057004 RepID=UPI00316FB89E
MNIAPSQKDVPDSAEDYVAYTTRFTPATGYFGMLSLVRTTDLRKLYPFNGASDIGPFQSVDAARDAANELAAKLIEADLKCPE